MRRRAILAGATAIVILLSVLVVGEQARVGVDGWENREPIHIYGNDSFTVENGVVSGCGTSQNPYVIAGWCIVPQGGSAGIAVEHTTLHFVIRNCSIEGASGAAIHLKRVSNGRIEGCQLLGSERGILLEDSDYNVIVGNLIAENLYGVVMTLGSKGNTVTENSFIWNGRAAYDPERRNLWHRAGIGNYWSGYEGRDADGDGIGDQPYSPLGDRYPLTASPMCCALPTPYQSAARCVTSTKTIVEGAVAGSKCVPPCVPTCAPVVEASVDHVISCSRNEVTLTATLCAGTPPCSYEWTKPGVGVVGRTPSITVNEPGTYTVTITGEHDASASDTVVVIADVASPVVHASVDRPISCAAPEVTLTAEIAGGCPPYTIQWTKPGSGVVGCEPSVAVSEPGIYTVVVAGANGCSTSDSVTVTASASPPIVTATVDQPLTCVVKEVTLNADVSGGEPPYTIEWTKSGSGVVVGRAASVTVRETGTYFATATGANGCSASAGVIVTEDVVPPVVKATVDRQLTCAVTEVTLTAHVSGGSPPYSVEWSTPAGLISRSQRLAVSEPGSYIVTATGSNGCTASDTVTVKQDIDPPTVDAGPDQLITEETPQVTLTVEVGSRGPYTVTWEEIIEGVVVGHSDSITVSKPGTYRATVVRDTGCSASDEVTVSSHAVSKVTLNSDIEGLAVFGQLTLDGVPIPETVFYLQTGETDPVAEEATTTTVSFIDVTGKGVIANGAEVSYIIPGNAAVRFTIHGEQFIAGKEYWLLHLPTDPPGAASIAFF